MTTPETAQVLALIAAQARIAAAQARIAGMQAENQYRIQCGNSIAYGEDAFCVEAGHLEALAQQVINQ